MGSMKEVFNSLFLKELLKGMSVTGKYFFARKITVQYPEEKTPQSARFPVVLVNPCLDDGVDRARLFAETAENTLGQIYVIARRPP